MTTPDDLINILIVDDEPTNLVVLETVLSDPSYRLVRAQSAEQALLALMQEEFALLVLDIHMPGMTGFELAQMVKERKKTSHIPIIFLTAYYDQDQHMLAGYGSGAVDYLNKPVNPAVLRSKVSIFADLHRKSRELLQANSILKTEIRERLRAEEELRELNESLERRVAERTEALVRSDQKLQSVMDSITDGFYTLDHDWRFTYCNEQGARLFGMSTGDLLGGVIWDLFPKMKGTGFYEGYMKAAQTRNTVSVEELYSDLPAKWFECHCYPSEDGVSVYFHEITERREAEALREQLLAAEQAARIEGDRVARAKDEFLTSLSHELRTPLAAILGWAMVLKRPGIDVQTLQRGIDAITKNAQAQTQLVSELLDTSRIVSGKLHVELERIDLNSVAAAAVDTLRPSAQAKGVSIELVPNTETRLELMGDVGRLAQIATNLLTNAVKFTPSAGAVTVATRRDGSHVELIISDTGDGIRQEFLPYLFDRFSQADGSAARIHGGLGLGLSIVRDLVELHAGTIAAQSRGKDLGSTFVVRFPAAPAVDPGEDTGLAVRGQEAVGAAASAESERPRTETTLGGVRVLLVDDHDDVLEVERRLLSECGAVVGTAASAEDALRLLKTQMFDVLLSDLGMPGMDGYQLIGIIRTSQDQGLARMPAAAVTAFVRAEDRQRALAAGYQAFLRKPVSPTALVTTVAELARRR
jgi:PAS domain S-box-containing protein